MGQYRLSFYFKWQFGAAICYEPMHNIVEIKVAFIKILIGLDKTAHGCFFFFE